MQLQARIIRKWQHRLHLANALDQHRLYRISTSLTGSTSDDLNYNPPKSLGSAKIAGLESSTAVGSGRIDDQRLSYVGHWGRWHPQYLDGHQQWEAKNGDMDNVDISSLYLPALVTVEVFSTSNILNWDLMSGLLVKRWWMTRHEKLWLYVETMALKAILNRTPDRRLKTLLLVLTGGKQDQQPVNEKEASGHQNILGTCASPPYPPTREHMFFWLLKKHPGNKGNSHSCRSCYILLWLVHSQNVTQSLWTWWIQDTSIKAASKSQRL